MGGGLCSAWPGICDGRERVGHAHHGAPLERLEQLGDALHSVGACNVVADTAEVVPVQTVQRWGVAVSVGAETEANTRAAAHFSRLSTPFSLMQLAMMKAEATRSCLSLFERSIRSVGFVPLSSSILSA